MSLAVVNDCDCIGLSTQPIHRLQVEPVECHVFKPLRVRIQLWINQLQFMPRFQNNFGFTLGADADPVDSSGRFTCPVGLNSDFKPMVMQSLDQRRIELQKRFASRTDHEAMVTRIIGPILRYPTSQGLRRLKLAAPRSIHPNKVGVAEAAYGRRIGPARDPTIGCSRQTGKTLPDDPYWRPHLARLGTSLSRYKSYWQGWTQLTPREDHTASSRLVEINAIQFRQQRARLRANPFCKAGNIAVCKVRNEV